jgi:acyl-CoA thioester hydrolase
MGFVHHGAYVYYLEAARIEYLRRRGLRYAEWTRQGIHLPVVETHLRHRRPAFFDDLLVVRARLAQLTRVTLRFEYELWREQPEPLLLVEAHTVLACVDESHKPRRIPEEAAVVLLGPESVTPLGKGC